MPLAPVQDDRSPAEKKADLEKQTFSELRKAQEADTLISNPLLKEAVEAVKDQLWQEFQQKDMNDDRGRLACQIGLEMLNRTLKHIREHIRTGKLAKASLSDTGS